MGHEASQLPLGAGGLMLTEEWRAVPGFEPYYEVSNQGRVRSLDRLIYKRVMRNGPEVPIQRYGKLLSPGIDSHGYLMVNLCVEGANRSRMVHHLVLLAFGPPRPDNTECRHLDGRRYNNCFTNLCWGTAQENTLDKFEHGTINPPKGEAHGLSKLTVGDVKNIRTLADVVPVSLIAVEYAISENHARRLIKRKAWEWLS